MDVYGTRRFKTDMCSFIFLNSYKPLKNVLFDMCRCLNDPFSGGITDLEGIYSWLGVTDRHLWADVNMF